MEKVNKEIRTYSLKLLTLGESTVGKTSIVSKLCDDKFSEGQLMTTGIDSRTFTLKYNENTVVNVSLWDTAGQERFHNITKQFFTKVNGILLVYDITAKTSFERINLWMEEINNIIKVEELGFVLLGNKNDLELQRVIHKEDGKKLAAKLNMPFFETSAKTGKNLKESLAVLCEQTIKKLELSNPDNERNSKLSWNSQTKSDKKCCKSN